MTLGILEKNFEKRFNYEKCINHPWVYYIKDKIEYIKNIYSSDPEKMIKELDNLEVKDSDFTGKYQCFDVIIHDNKNTNPVDDSLKKSEKSLKKKRNRQN
jgi:hypothetical protein